QYSDGCGPVFDAQELEQIRRGCLRIDPYFVQSKSYLLSDRFRTIGLRDSTVVAENINDGMIGHRAAIGETPPFEIGNPLTLQSLPKFVQQSGFPATCFGDNPHHLSLSYLDLSK